MKPAIAYLRRSLDRSYIATFAEQAAYQIVAEFAEQPQGDAKPFSRPGFAAMLRHIEAKGVNTIIVANATAFVRDPLARAVGAAKLRQYGIELLVVDDVGFTASTAFRADQIDQVLAFGADFDQALRSASLGARTDRLRTKLGPSHRRQYADTSPDAVHLAKHLHHQAVRNKT